MAGATERFFDDLAKRGHVPMLGGVSGTLRLDLVGEADTGHYYVAIKKGDVRVTCEAEEADAVVRGSRAFFDRVTSGRENATAAALRGLIMVEGDVSLVVQFQRLFPGPPPAGGDDGAGGGAEAAGGGAAAGRGPA